MDDGDLDDAFADDHGFAEALARSSQTQRMRQEEFERTTESFLAQERERLAQQSPSYDPLQAASVSRAAHKSAERRPVGVQAEPEVGGSDQGSGLPQPTYDVATQGEPQGHFEDSPAHVEHDDVADLSDVQQVAQQNLALDEAELVQRSDERAEQTVLHASQEEEGRIGQHGGDQSGPAADGAGGVPPAGGDQTEVLLDQEHSPPASMQVVAELASDDRRVSGGDGPPHEADSGPSRGQHVRHEFDYVEQQTSVKMSISLVPLLRSVLLDNAVLWCRGRLNDHQRYVLDQAGRKGEVTGLEEMSEGEKVEAWAGLYVGKLPQNKLVSAFVIALSNAVPVGLEDQDVIEMIDYFRHHDPMLRRVDEMTSTLAEHSAQLSEMRSVNRAQLRRFDMIELALSYLMAVSTGKESLADVYPANIDVLRPSTMVVRDRFVEQADRQRKNDRFERGRDFRRR